MEGSEQWNGGQSALAYQEALNVKLVAIGDLLGGAKAPPTDSHPAVQRFSYSGYGHTLQLQYTTNPDGSMHMLKVVIDGMDRTGEAIQHGGSATCLSPILFCNAYHHSALITAMGWEFSGTFGRWLKQATSIQINQ